MTRITSTMFSMASMTSIIRNYSVVLALAVLSACGGGAPTTENPNTSPQQATAAYNGPPPATADIQAFKLNFWDNLQSDDRCGTCHKNTQSPRFVRADDINIAYQEANTIVDLANPGLSRVVEKVRGGHHCWLTDNNACGDTMVRWITAWASVTQGGAGRQIQLIAPTPADPGPARIMPDTPTAGGANSFANTVYPILTANCARCHRADAATPQQPFFASSDVNVAYDQAKTKMNLDAPSMSRLVVRLRTEFHNCWRIPSNGAVDCAASATVMQDAITAFAGSIPSQPVPTSWVTSKALSMYNGTIASGGNRYDNNVIAMYEFKTGTGTTAYDTSGVQPAMDLTLSNTAAGGFQWVGGWGVQFTGGKAQGLTTTSKKLTDLISSTGEYSIEAWAAPGNVTQEDSRIVSYSGGLQVRNFTLGQTMYNYDFFARTSTSNTNGMPQFSTPDARKALQATLQHVVATFSPVDGRKIYVNGELIASSAGGTSIGTWDDTLAFVLGNEASGNRPWLGTLKLVAIHNRALTQPQVAQNFAAGVGEKYFLLFGISHLVNIPQSYIMFEVSQYDSYAYLFNYPKFISLDPNARPGNLVVKGMRIGINGTEPLVGQAYRMLNVTVTDQMYTATAGASLSNIGTIIALQQGPAFDQFFLTFEQLGSMTNVRVEPVPAQPAPPPDVARPSDIGVRTFDGINNTFAKITGVSKNNAGVKATYAAVRQQMPMDENFKGFLASHQTAIAQLAISYCGALVDDATLRTSFFGNVNMSSPLTSLTDIDAVVMPVVNKVSGLNLTNQPATAMRDQLRSLINNTDPNNAQGLCAGTNSCGTGRTATVMKVTCAAGLGSAVMLVQ